MTAPLDDTTVAALDLARRTGAELVVQVWGDPDQLPAPMASRGVALEPVAVDLSVLELLEAVAGPVIA